MNNINSPYTPLNSVQRPVQIEVHTPLNIANISFDYSEHDIFSPAPLAELEKNANIKQNTVIDGVISTPTSVDLRFRECPGAPKRETRTAGTVDAQTQTTATVISEPKSKVMDGFAAGALVGLLSAVACMMRLFK